MIFHSRQLVVRKLNRLRLIGTLLIVVMSMATLLLIENMMVSFILASVIAYILGPLVNDLERRGMDRFWATFVVFGGAGLLIGGLTAWLTPYAGTTFGGLQTEAPNYIAGIGKVLAIQQKRLSEFLGPLSSFDLKDFIETSLSSWTQNLFDQAPGFLKKFITVMLLGPFLAFFMVKDGRNILRQTLAIVPNNIFEPALSILHQINQQIGYFVRARLLEAGIVGLVIWIGLISMSMPYALLLALIAAVTNLIPYIGPIIGFVPALAFALVDNMSSVSILTIVIVYLIAQIIDVVFLIPIMVAKIVNLHPVTVIIVIIAGAQVMGIIGMVISIPFAATMKVTIGTIYRYLTESEIA